MVWPFPYGFKYSDERLHPSKAKSFACRQVLLRAWRSGRQLNDALLSKRQSGADLHKHMRFLYMRDTHEGGVSWLPARRDQVAVSHRSEAGSFRQPTLLSVGCRLEKRGPLRAVQRRSQEAAGTRELIRFCPISEISRICWASDNLSATPPTETWFSGKGFGWKPNFYRRKRRAS